MFKLITEEDYLWPVEIKIPQAGRYKIIRLKARFRYLEPGRLEDLINQGDEGSDRALLDEALVGWQDFPDAYNEPIEYTEENRQQAIDTDYVRVGLVRGLMESIAGKQSRRKN